MGHKILTRTDYPIDIETIKAAHDNAALQVAQDGAVLRTPAGQLSVSPHFTVLIETAKVLVANGRSIAIS